MFSWRFAMHFLDFERNPCGTNLNPGVWLQKIASFFFLAWKTGRLGVAAVHLKGARPRLQMRPFPA
jgi:hypothetical protein